jgi:hypothetical protein
LTSAGKSKMTREKLAPSSVLRGPVGQSHQVCRADDARKLVPEPQGVRQRRNADGWARPRPARSSGRQPSGGRLPRRLSRSAPPQRLAERSVVMLQITGNSEPCETVRTSLHRNATEDTWASRLLSSTWPGATGSAQFTNSCITNVGIIRNAVTQAPEIRAPIPHNFASVLLE